MLPNLLNGAAMHNLRSLFLFLAAATGCASAQRCPAVVSSLAEETTFSTLASTVGCVTPQADAFLVLYQAGDVEGLRALARTGSAGAQLYALCGFKHLHADADETVLRGKLIASHQLTASGFDLRYDYLIANGTESYRQPCDTRNARPTCR